MIVGNGLVEFFQTLQLKALAKGIPGQGLVWVDKKNQN